MSIQLASTDEIQVLLDAAPTNQLPVHTSWVDQGGLGDNLPTLTAGTSPVTVVPSPVAGIERLVSQINIPNADTSQRTVTVNLVRSGTSYLLRKITLLVGYALEYNSGQWRVMDPNGNFLCDVTVSGGSITSAQGTPATLANAWPTKLTDGTNVLGTPANPLRMDPTGTTTQPVSVGNFPATQNVNINQLDGATLAGPTAWGVAPASGSQVINVNANIVAGGGGAVTSNITEWNSVALGSPSNYGTSPGSVPVIGVNAFITNLPATQPVSGSVSVSNFPATQTVSGSVSVSNFPAIQAQNLTQLAGSALGAPSNYGTSPGAVTVQGVNAFVTNSVAVTGTFWQATQPVSLASLPSLAAGSNVIGGVTQSGGPWTLNLTQVAGSALAAPTAYGTAPSSGNVLAVNANVTNTPTTKPSSMVLSSGSQATTTVHQFGATAGYGILRFCKIDLVGYTNSSQCNVAIEDGAGNTIFIFAIPPVASAFTQFNAFFSDNLGQAITTTTGGVQVITSNNPSSGSIYVQVGASN